MPREKSFEAVELVSEDGRVVTIATSRYEEKYLREQGYDDFDEDKTGRNARSANAGREGNKRAAESSTTKEANDGVERAATSNA